MELEIITPPTAGAQMVDRAALLLRLVAAGPPSTFTQLAVRSGIARSTVSRVLLALERNGLVRRDGSRMFLPGPLLTGNSPDPERRGPARLDRAIETVARLRDQINAGENWSEQVIELRLKDVLDELLLARLDLSGLP